MRLPRKCRLDHVLAVILLAALVWGLPAAAEAGTGAVVNYPLGNIKAVSGLQMSISSHWMEGNGYRPVTFEFTSLPKAVADRRLTVMFSPNSWGPAGRASRVQFDVEIPEGSTKVSKTVSVPQKEIWYQWSVTVSEEGRKLRDLSGNTGVPRPAQSWGWTEAYPTMLFIDSDAPDPATIGQMVAQIQAQGTQGKGSNKLPNVRRLSRFFAPHNNYQQQLIAAVGSNQPTDNDILVMLRNLPTVELVPPSALPSEWIDFTCADVIVLSLDDLRQTIAQQPNQWSALREYITTGGNLFVYGVGDEFEHLNELEQLLSISTVEPESKTRNQRFAGWTDPSPNRYGLAMASILPAEEYVTTYRGAQAVTRSIGGPRPERRLDKDGKIPPAMFVTRSLGMGQVAAIGPEDAFAVDDRQWDWLFSHLGQDRWQWYRRNGLSRGRINDEFWDFMIPDVGAAPVKMFLAIITAFMVLIGPVNYFFLRRWKRLYFLLVTVPAGAGLITLCLFTYALLSDGLGTRARIRSFTEIDSKNNSAVSWSRQSYYAGLAPSGGMIFPRHTAIYPIDHAPMVSNKRTRVLRWGETQNLASGFLGARSMSQLMVVNSVATTEQVVVERNGNTVTAENQLQSDVAQLLVCDDEQLYWGERIPAGEKTQLQSISREDVRERLTEFRSANRPRRPEGFVSPRTPRNYMYYYNSSDNQFTPPSVLTSVLEQQISLLSSTPSKERRVYFAMTTSTPSTVPIGVQIADQKSGFHIIKGTW